jgi:hypothetical protein
MKEIQLNTVATSAKNYMKYKALVDDDDYVLLSKYKWHVTISGTNMYAMGKVNNSIIFMHRVILNAKDGKFIDHKDGNGLNNQKSNLRFCTKSQNGSNIRKKRRGTSKYIGVSLHMSKWCVKAIGYNTPVLRTYYSWQAKISVNGKAKHLGVFKAEEDAAKAYDNAALLYKGDFAVLNFPDK